MAVAAMTTPQTTGVASEFSTLKVKHAQHILEVIRGAKKQEAERQRKLRHAASSEQLAYLQKRFDAERRQDRKQISGLVDDANAVEAALLRVAPSGHHRGKGPTCTKKGGVDRPPEAGPSTKGIGGGGSAKCNAFVEPEKREDPKFISLNQMRFMKYVYQRVDGAKVSRAHKDPAGLVDASGRIRRRIRGSKESAVCSSIPSKVEGASAACLETGGRETYGGVAQSVQGKTECKVWEVKPQNNDGGSSDKRKRLLAEKRGILLEMKGIVSRQAEALDRLVESSANVKRAMKYDRRSNDGRSRRSRSFHETSGGSTKSGFLFSEGIRRDGHSMSPAMLSKIIPLCKPAQPPPPALPPENETSAFLARGGRWSGESRRERPVSRSNSRATASSASYATYGKRGAEEGRAVFGVGRRPVVVPALQVVRR